MHSSQWSIKNTKPYVAGEKRRGLSKLLPSISRNRNDIPADTGKALNRNLHHNFFCWLLLAKETDTGHSFCLTCSDREECYISPIMEFLSVLYLIEYTCIFVLEKNHQSVIDKYAGCQMKVVVKGVTWFDLAVCLIAKQFFKLYLDKAWRNVVWVYILNCGLLFYLTWILTDHIQ